MKNHKTFIVLDGGSSKDMKNHLKNLKFWNLKYAEFREPDLNNSISAIAVVLDEDYYNYPEEDSVGGYFRKLPLAR